MSCAIWKYLQRFSLDFKEIRYSAAVNYTAQERAQILTILSSAAPCVHKLILLKNTMLDT